MDDLIYDTHNAIMMLTKRRNSSSWKAMNNGGKFYEG
jgi:hypothetical protein